MYRLITMPALRKLMPGQDGQDRSLKANFAVSRPDRLRRRRCQRWASSRSIRDGETLPVEFFRHVIAASLKYIMP